MIRIANFGIGVTQLTSVVYTGYVQLIAPWYLSSARSFTQRSQSRDRDRQRTGCDRESWACYLVSSVFCNTHPVSGFMSNVDYAITMCLLLCHSIRYLLLLNLWDADRSQFLRPFAFVLLTVMIFLIVVGHLASVHMNLRLKSSADDCKPLTPTLNPPVKIAMVSPKAHDPCILFLARPCHIYVTIALPHRSFPKFPPFTM